MACIGLKGAEEVRFINYVEMSYAENINISNLHDNVLAMCEDGSGGCDGDSSKL